MKNKDLTLKNLRTTRFSQSYEDFLLDRNMNSNKYMVILSLAILFINNSNKNIQRLGYRIIVIYSNRTKDYKPLYEIASNYGLIPVSQFIEEQLIDENEKNVFTEINTAFSQKFFLNNVYCTCEQKNLIDFYNSNNNESLSIVAPTSYGKTDLILYSIENNQDKSICVITPTKSLLTQTKSRIIKSGKITHRNVITHPEMYRCKQKNILAVMTQERVLRLLKKFRNLDFDYVIIDEAHELLHDDVRSVLLASVIIVLCKRNPKTVFKFLTPFLCDTNNLRVHYTDYTLKTYPITEYIKTERIYIADLRKQDTKEFFLYDQFLNEFYEIGNCQFIDEYSFVQKHAEKKNVIYLNKPKDIESFVSELISTTDKKIETELIENVCKHIAEYVHPKYRLIDAIKKGVIYHHGGVPEPVRMYAEKIYSECEEIKYVVTSSTLLEGVNIPADKMFILDNKKGRGNLSKSDFKNLIGRVCRFSQIFNKKNNSLKKLEPEIYLVAGKYTSERANLKKFIQNSMSVENIVKDKLENVLLEKKDISTRKDKESYKKAKEFIENYEEGIIQDSNVNKVKTEVGKYCFMNNVTEIDILAHEKEIQKQLEMFITSKHKISDIKTLLEVMYKLFFSKSDEDTMKRFEHDETIRFYEMFLNWRIENKPLKQIINSFLSYWRTLPLDENHRKIVYVGRWGELSRGGFKKLWTDITDKTTEELINLAIVKIKEEQDYIDNVLIKYVEVLYDLGIIQEKLYLQIKYGTDDKRIIACVQSGISLSLAKLLIESYADYVTLDTEDNFIKIDECLIEKMRENKENEVMICELNYFL